MRTSTIEVGELVSTLSAAGVHRQLSTLPGVHHADVNYVAGSATVHYDEATIKLDAICQRVLECGYHCRGELVPAHVCDAADHRAVGDAHAGHAGGMSMQGMTDDMRNRFLVALVFAVPVFLYSPMGAMFGNFPTPFGMDRKLFLFFAATAAIAYPVWPFVVAAVRAARNKVANMATHIVLSVGTGYLFSVGATFFYESEVFFEASAVLLVFILLGHWLEMRARAGASDAIRALMDLAPPMATVVREGVETQVPTAQVLAGETVVIKPGDNQNLWWAVGYNVIAFPLAAGVFYPFTLSPEIAALSMSGSSAVVAINALMLKRTKLAGIKSAGSPGAQAIAASVVAGASA